MTRQSQCHGFCCWHLKFLLVFQEGAPLFTEHWAPPPNSAFHADLKASSHSCSPQGILYPSPWVMSIRSQSLIPPHKPPSQHHLAQGFALWQTGSTKT